MTLTLNLPDAPALRHVSEADMRLELACALHAQGRISKTAGADRLQKEGRFFLSPTFRAEMLRLAGEGA